VANSQTKTPGDGGQVPPPLFRLWPGLTAYAESLAAMRAFTDARQPDSRDEIWLIEHQPVFTQGQAGRDEHLHTVDAGADSIPVVRSDRGGQITYHGPGQIVAYLLLDLKRLDYGIRSLVTRIEQSVIETLAIYNISAYADPAAPGVYVDVRGQRAKIASLGLRVRRGCSYHGLALNTDMDLSPFSQIDPCGYRGLSVTQIRDLGGPDLPQVQADLQAALQRRLGYEPGPGNSEG